MKTCVKCGVEKTLENFTSKTRPYKDTCDSCKAEIILEKSKARNKKYAESHKDKIREHNRNYARRNQEKVNAYNREYKKRVKEAETPEQREKRLNYMREARKKRLSNETPEEKSERLAKNKEKLKKEYAADPERFKKYREKYFAKNSEKKIEKIENLRKYTTNKGREQERFNKLLAETLRELQIN